MWNNAIKVKFWLFKTIEIKFNRQILRLDLSLTCMTFSKITEIIVSIIMTKK